MGATGDRFERAVEIMARLRAAGGCPWDREQTFDTIKPFTLEETYEVLEAIDTRDWDGLPEELGDLLLQVLFYSQMANEEKRFAIDDVLERLASKLIGRHPHVFGDVRADTSSEVLRNWEALKREEKKQRASRAESGGDAKAEPALAGISTAMPSLLEAHKISSRAAQLGFDWPEIGGLFEKLQEETVELKQEIGKLPQAPKPQHRGVAGAGAVPPPEALRGRLEDELGDMFFVLVNIARYLSLDPESALRKSNRKFRRRFGWLEEQFHKQGKKLADASLEEMEAVWQQAKEDER